MEKVAMVDKLTAFEANISSLPVTNFNVEIIQEARNVTFNIGEHECYVSIEPGNALDFFVDGEILVGRDYFSKSTSRYERQLLKTQKEILNMINNMIRE